MPAWRIGRIGNPPPEWFWLPFRRIHVEKRCLLLRSDRKELLAVFETTLRVAAHQCIRIIIVSQSDRVPELVSGIVCALYRERFAHRAADLELPPRSSEDPSSCMNGLRLESSDNRTITSTVGAIWLKIFATRVRVVAGNGSAESRRSPGGIACTTTCAREPNRNGLPSFESSAFQK